MKMYKNNNSVSFQFKLATYVECFIFHAIVNETVIHTMHES